MKTKDAKKPADAKKVRKIEAIDDETFRYTPNACLTVDAVDEDGKKTGKKIAPTHTGSVVLRRMDLEERCELTAQLAELRGAFGDDNVTNQIKVAAFAVKSTKHLWVSVDLTKIAGGKKFDSLKSLMFDQSADKIVLEVATSYLDGFKDQNGDDLGN